MKTLIEMKLNIMRASHLEYDIEQLNSPRVQHGIFVKNRNEKRKRIL